jgi:hypothetical protein
VRAIWWQSSGMREMWRAVFNILSLYSQNHHHHFRGVILSSYLTIAANVFVVGYHGNCSPGYLSQGGSSGEIRIFI